MIQARQSSVLLEITNLVIPEANDAPDDIRRMCVWIRETLGAEVPLHFSAFHPDFRMRDRPPTPPETLNHAREIALHVGLKYVYTGNVSDVARQSTYCPACRKRLIERDWYTLGEYHIHGGCCDFCGTKISGHFEDAPGHWGGRRLPVDPAALLRGMRSETARTV